jgi:hypothetical protein
MHLAIKQHLHVQGGQRLARVHDQQALKHSQGGRAWAGSAHNQLAAYLTQPSCAAATGGSVTMAGQARGTRVGRSAARDRPGSRFRINSGVKQGTMVVWPCARGAATST